MTTQHDKSLDVTDLPPQLPGQVWYFRSFGMQHGPLKLRELIPYIRSGRLHPASVVWRKGMPKWVAASTVKELKGILEWGSASRSFAFSTNWLLIVPALIYATGFLVASAYMERFGIREIDNGLWKTRFMHIGFLCLSLPVVVNTTVYSLIYFARSRNEEGSRQITFFKTGPLVLSVLVVEVVCYVFLMLSRPYGDSQHAMGYKTVKDVLFSGIGPIIALSAMSGPVTYGYSKLRHRFFGLRDLDDEPPFWLPYIIPFFRWMFFGATIIFARCFFQLHYDMLKEIWDAHKMETTGFLGFTFLLGYIPFQLVRNSATLVRDDQRRALWLFGLAFVTLTYYLLTQSFAYSIFPYIPARIGGGDYTGRCRVVVSAGSGVLPVMLVDKSTSASSVVQSGVEHSKQLTLLEEGGSMIYVADPTDTNRGSPNDWRSDFRTKPIVYQLRRENLLHMRLEQLAPINRSVGPDPRVNLLRAVVSGLVVSFAALVVVIVWSVLTRDRSSRKRHRWI